MGTGIHGKKTYEKNLETEANGTPQRQTDEEPTGYQNSKGTRALKCKPLAGDMITKKPGSD